MFLDRLSCTHTHTHTHTHTRTHTEKETKTTKTPNLDCVHVSKSVHEPIRVREKSLTARFVTDADADTHTERIYGCLSIFNHCFDFHGH